MRKLQNVSPSKRLHLLVGNTAFRATSEYEKSLRSGLTAIEIPEPEFKSPLGVLLDRRARTNFLVCKPTIFAKPRRMLNDIVDCLMVAIKTHTIYSSKNSTGILKIPFAKLLTKNHKLMVVPLPDLLPEKFVMASGIRLATAPQFVEISVFDSHIPANELESFIDFAGQNPHKLPHDFLKKKVLSKLYSQPEFVRFLEKFKTAGQAADAIRAGLLVKLTRKAIYDLAKRNNLSLNLQTKELLELLSKEYKSKEELVQELDKIVQQSEEYKRFFQVKEND